MKVSDWTLAAVLATFSLLLTANSGMAAGTSFEERFETYAAGSNLDGQGGWSGQTNQGTATEMPVTAGSFLQTGQVLNTRAISQADRIHQIGHDLPVLSSSVVSTFSVDAYALSDSINTGIGIGENPSPGPEIASAGGFFADYRANWAYAAGGWFLDLRGIAGSSDTNIFRLNTGTGKRVTLEIVVDGPAGVIYGRLYDGAAVLTTDSRPITAEQIAAIDAVAIFSDRSLSGRAGVEFDNIRLTTTGGALPRPCGDVDKTGAVTATDALAVLKAAVGQPVALQCPYPAQPLQTGQRTCHDAAGAQLSCSGTAQDGELQLGATRSFTDNGDGTISDDATGLTWEKLSDDGSIHDMDDTYTWTGAFGKIAALNQAAFAGHSDWRLPNVRELETLRDFDAAGPPVVAVLRQPCAPGTTVLDGSCTASGAYWSSTTGAGDPTRAWAVSFATGATSPDDKGASYYVRAVRGGD